MRILVHEFVSGGGMLGHRLPLSLAREGAAMLEALLVDLIAVPGHELLTTRDPRVPLHLPPGVEVVEMRGDPLGTMRRLAREVDAVWPIAPEIGGCLAGLAALVEEEGVHLIGPCAAAIRLASDKLWLARALAGARLPTPLTVPARDEASALELAAGLHFPVVVKPSRGAGCVGVGFAGDARQLRGAFAAARAVAGGDDLLIQPFLPGKPISVSLLCHGGRAAALTVNAQRVQLGTRSGYQGGETPLLHPLAALAAERACAAVALVPGLQGYVGVDLVLTRGEAVILEINPRLTTSYLGVRAVLDGNPAALALDACEGRLPEALPVQRWVRFTTEGAIELPTPTPS